jgi:hypothetical protein
MPGGGPDWQAQKDSWRRSRSRTLPDLPRLSWTDWRAEDLLRVVRGSLEEENAPLGVDSSSDKGTPSMGNDLFKDFIEDALLQADDLDEIDFWTTHFAVDGDLLWKAIDCNLVEHKSRADFAPEFAPEFKLPLSKLTATNNIRLGNHDH